MSAALSGSSCAVPVPPRPCEHGECEGYELLVLTIQTA